MSKKSTAKKTVAADPPFEPTPPKPAEVVVQSMELTVVQTAVTSMTRLEAGLDDLRKRFKDVVYDCATEQGMADAKAARKEIATPRIAVESIREEAKQPILELGRKLDGTAKRIKDELLALEKPITAQIQAEEDRIAREEEEKIQAEAKRVGDIQVRIAAIRDSVARAAECVTADQVGAVLNTLVGTSADGTFEEFADIANEALQAAIVRVREQFLAAIQREEQTRELARQQEEINRQRAEQAQRDREANERAERERLRVASIMEDIAELRGNRNLTPADGSALIAGHIFDLENLLVTEEKFSEYLQQAIDARAAGLAWLQHMHVKAISYEAEEKRQAQARELLAAQQRDQDRAAAIQTRMNFFNDALVRGLRMNTSQELQRLIAEVEARVVDESFEGFQEQARGLKDSALGVIRESYKAFYAREEEARQQQERERVAREEKERQEREAEEARKVSFRPTLDQLADVVQIHYECSFATARQWIRSAVADEKTAALLLNEEG